jgi:probable phosphoglycerate mutase
VHVYLIRHADPDYERDSLTEQGFQEAAALAERLHSLHVTRLHTSIAKRAILTGEPFAKRHPEVPIQRHAWLLEPAHLTVEQDGRRYSLWDTYGEKIRAGDTPPTQATWRQSPPFDAPSVRDMWDDFRRAADDFLAAHGLVRQGGRYRVTRAPPGRVAVICHNGTILLLLAHLLDLPVSLVFCGFYSWPASVTTLYFEQHSDTWAVPRLLHVADVSHLAAAGLEPQPRAMGPDRYEPYV